MELNKGLCRLVIDVLEQSGQCTGSVRLRSHLRKDLGLDSLATTWIERELSERLGEEYFVLKPGVQTVEDIVLCIQKHGIDKLPEEVA